MVYLLSEDEISFPHPSLADEDGLLAVGGDLSSERLLLAYKNGIFPWFSEDDPICWFAPHERCIITPQQLVVSKSMRKFLRRNIFKVTVDKAFDAVIDACANIERKGQDGTWITDEMLAAYKKLHMEGFAHSIEVWQGDTLAGGMYGIQIGKVFCGESMFSEVSNASKTALIWLLEQNDIELLDCQMPNEHLTSLGATMIDADKFRTILSKQQ